MSPACSTSPLASLADETSAWRRRAAQLRRERARLVGDTRAVAHDDLGARAGELPDDRLADALRASGDKRPLPLRGSRRVSSQARWRPASSDFRSFTEIARTELSILFSKPPRTLPGPTSTNVVTPCPISSVAAWVKRTGAVSCSTSRLRKRYASSMRAGLAVETNWEVGVLKSIRSSAGRSPLGRESRRAGSGTRPDTLSRTARAAPRHARLCTALVDRRGLAGDDELAGAVVVRGPDVRDRAAERLDGLVGETEDRRHRPGARAGRCGGREPALAHELDRLPHAERVGRSERRELSDRMTDHVVGVDLALAQGGVDRKARRHERGLLQLGLRELLVGAVEAEPASGSRAPTPALPCVVDGHRLGHGFGDLPAHTELERALAGEHEGDLRH